MASTSRTLTAKFDGDTTGLAAAAKRGEKIVDDFGDKSGKKFGSGFGGGFKNWLAGDGTKLFGESGQFGGSVFGSGLLGALKTPVLGPALIATLGATMAVAMPAVGAIAAGALVFAFGAGLVGLGLAVTRNSPKVQAAMDRMIKPIGPKLKELAKPFEDTWVEILAGARNTFDKFAPALGKAFKALAPVTAIFAGQFFDAMEELEPVIAPVVDAFAAIAKSLGPALPGIVGGIAKGITAIAESVEKNPTALTDFFEGIGDILTLALGLLAALNDMNGAIEDLTGGLSGVDVLFSALTFPLALLTLGVKAATFQLKFLDAAWGKVKKIFTGKWIAKLSADAGPFFTVLGKALKSAGKWAASRFMAAVTADAQGVFTVLSKAYEAAAKWVSSFFKARFGVDIGSVFDRFNDALKVGRNWAGKVFNATFGGIKGGGIPFLPGLAHGGAAMPGRSYLVGERGPEILTMGATGGSVTPNHELGGGDVTVFITIDGQQLQGRIDKTVRGRDRGVKRALSAGATRGS